MTATAAPLPDAATDATARRLLRSTAKQSYDPEVDIDWDAPLVDGAWFMQPERLSLYGTPIWEAMTRGAARRAVPARGRRRSPASGCGSS